MISEKRSRRGAYSGKRGHSGQGNNINDEADNLIVAALEFDPEGMRTTVAGAAAGSTISRTARAAISRGMPGDNSRRQHVRTTRGEPDEVTFDQVILTIFSLRIKITE
jgi:hypothetical protein